MSPGIIRYFIDHNVEIKGQQNIHAFAVVDWLMSSEPDFGYGRTPCLFGFLKTLRMLDQQFSCLFRESTPSFYVLINFILDRIT